MRHQQISYLTVGLFVLAMLAGLMATLAHITGRTGPTDSYFVHYDDVTGLVSGTPVTYQGFRVGRVGDIVPEGGAKGTTRYKVQLKLDRVEDEDKGKKPWPVAQDSVARVVSPGLLAEVVIDISGGKPGEPIPVDSEIKGEAAVGLFEAVDSIVGEVNYLNRKGFMPLLANIDERIQSFADKVSGDTSQVLGHLNNSTAKLDEGVADILPQLRELASRLNAGAEDLRRVVGPENRDRVGGFLTAIEGSAENFQVLSARLKASQAELHGLLVDSRDLVNGNRNNLDRSVNDLRATLQTVSEHIGAVAYNLEVTSRNMAEFSRQIRHNPGLLLSSEAPPDQGR
jgi:phospholipid/cholesterol/gamma-HCH transport system substrate-binding protein